jgi:uncharacterized protein (TIGR03084 family)
LLQEITDFHEEGKELRGLLATLAESDWQRKTLFKDWTVNDVVLHLHCSDISAAASVRDPAEYETLRAEITEKRKAGLSMIQESRQRFPELKGKALLTRWWDQLEKLCELLAAKDPSARLNWAGPGMGVRMFTTARQMETWAHGQEVYDVMGKDRVFHDRLKNIAVIGVKTFGWTFNNRKLPVPTDVPYVRVTGPSGEVWEWNDPASATSVTGDAVEFCQVVAQTRNIADTNLVVKGDTAQRWMQIAQCFAGPPNDPPAKGTRHKAKAAA